MSKFWDEGECDPISLLDIERHADALRFRVVNNPDDRIILETMLSKLGIKIKKRAEADMNGAKALASPKMGEDELLVSEQFAKSLLQDDIDVDRFDFFHELGHLTLHRNAQAPMPRMVGGNKRFRHIRPEASRELQADQFARAFALPRCMPWWGQTDELIARIVGVPEEQVSIRRVEIGHSKPSVPVVTAVARLAAEKIDLWKRLDILQGEDPTRFRLCDGFRICWSDYDKRYPPHQMGWYIVRGRIQAAISDS